MQALPLRRVPASADLEKPGDFAFIKAREPERTEIRTPVAPPKNPVKRFFWYMFGTTFSVSEKLIPQWPTHDTVILLCPVCVQPFATTRNHQIVSLEPLTIEPELTCPYCRTKSFVVKDGTIVPVVFHAA